MGNSSWFSLFPNVSLHNIVTPISDHTALVLKTITTGVTVGRRRFRFKNKWLTEPELLDLVYNCWTNL